MAVEGFQDLDFHEFHRRELPERLAAGNGAMAGRACHRYGSLALRLPDGSAYTYIPSPDGIEIASGDELADTVIEIDHESWEGLVHDYESAPGMLYGGRVKCLRGKAMKLVAWEPGLRAMFTGRPYFDPYHIELEDRHGGPLDPERSFTLESDREDMAHFLRTAGYLFVRNVFSPAETATFLEEAISLRGEAVKGDKLSWWGKNADGAEILCRVTRAGARPQLRTLPIDSRILSIVELADEQLVPRRGEGSQEGVSVIYKNPDMTEGLSDIPWHRDCGMGGHSVMCPTLIASVFLTPANAETGELKMLPGSWKGTCGYMDPSLGKAPEGVGFSAEPGDVSVHYGDVMHAAPPPSRSDLGEAGYRVSAITGFGRPDARNHRGASSYNDVLHGRADGQIEHLSKVAERS